MEKAEKEAQEARQAVKTQQQAVDQAQNELNLVQASQEEKQKNYDYAFAKVKALGGNTSATAESAATHQTQAEAALAQAKAEKIVAENEVNQKQTLLNQAQVESDAADENVKAKENALEKAENALKQLEAETNSSIVKKRADVDEKQNALDIAEKELEEKNVSISDAVEQKNKAEQALEEQEAELSVLQRELAAQTEDAATAQIEVDKKQAAYDEIKAMIMQLLRAQADYNQKQQEEVTAKTEYKNAQNIVNTLEAALADAKDTQAEAQSKEERAKALSYDAAFLNQITDPDFTYLNDEISKVKDAQSREALLQKAYDAAKQKAAESEEAYGQAKLENVRTLAELAVAQTTYDKYLAEQKAQEAAAQAKADEEFVKTLCEKKEIPCRSVSVDIPKMAVEYKMSEEEAGRTARREIFEQAAEEWGGTRIALAHHQDDNAETFFLHLARGSGLRGLGGIYPVNGMYIRPLLCVGRKEIEDYLKGREMPYCIDATNMEDAYMRNRIRNHVIPYFKENINEKTVEHMNRSMDQLREIWDYMERQTESAYQICTDQNGEKICIHADAYHRQERLIRKMLLRKALALVAEHEKDLEQVHVEKLEGLFEKQVGKRLDLPYGVCACRTYEGIELKRKKKDTELAEEEKNLDLKQVSGKISYGKWEISYRIFEKEECRCQIPKKTYTKWFDYGIIKQSVAVRTRRAGDFIVIDESGGRQKLKSYFINKKIPVAERAGIPLIAEGSEILWIVGCRQSKAYQVTEQTTKILEITINGGTLNGRESENVNSGRRSKCQN